MATQNINIVISATGGATVVRSLQSIGSAATNALSPLKLLERQIQTIMSILAIRQIAEWADEWLAAANKISVFAKNQAESNIILDRLYAVAQNVRQPLNEIVNLYHKLSIQTKELGVSTNQNIAFTEGIGKALAIQGTKASEAKGALLQLSQAMGTGKIKSQEYNSLLTGLPLVLLTVAKNLDGAGGSVAKLTAMQRAGQLTSRMFFDAFEKGLPELNAMFDKTQKTFAQGMTVFENGMVKFLGQLNQATGVSNGFYIAMKFIADNMENIAKVLLVIGAGVAAAFLPAILSAFIAGLQIVLGLLLRIAAVLLTNPFVLLVTAAVAAYAFGDSLDAGIDGLTTLRDILDAFGQAFIGMFGDFATIISYIWRQFTGEAEDANKKATSATEATTESWTKSYTDFYSDVGQGLAGFLRGVARTFDAIGGLLLGLIITWFTIIGGIPDAFESAFSRVYNVVTDIFNKLLNLIIDGINKIRTFMGDGLLPSIELQKRQVDEKYFQKWGRDIAGAVDEGFRMQGGALEKSLDGIFATAQASAKARAAKATSTANLDAHGTPGNVAGGNDKDNPALRHMQGQLKEQERLIKEEHAMMQERVKALDFLYQNEVITLRDSELAKQQLIQQNLTVTLAAYDDEEKAVRVYLAQAKKRTDIEGANNQLMEINAKRREAQAAATKGLADSEAHLLSVQLQFNNATKEAARNAEIARQGMEFEIDMLGKSTIEVQKATAARQIQLELEQRIYELKKKDPEADTSAAREQALQRTSVLLEQIQRKYDLQRTAVFGVGEAIRKYTEDAGNLAAQVEGALTNAFKGLEDALVDLVTTGKADFKSMVDSFIRDLARIEIKKLLSGAISFIMGDSSGAGSSGGGTAGALSSVSSLSSLYTYGSKAFSAISNWFGAGSAISTAAPAITAASTASTGAVMGGIETGGAAGIGSGTALGGAGAGSASTAGFAGIPVVGWILMGMMASASAFDQGFIPGKQGGVGYTVSDGGTFGPNGQLQGLDKLAQGLGVDAKTASILTGSALGSQAMYSVLGGYQVSPAGQFVTGTIGGSNNSLQNRSDFTQDHRGPFGIGSYTTHNSEYSQVDSGLNDYIQSATDIVKASIKKYADAVGISTGAIDTFTSQIEVSLSGLSPEDAKAAIDKAITGYMDALTTAVFGDGLTAMTKAGETSSQALMRVAQNFNVVNDALHLLGINALPVSVATVKAATGMVEAFGGIENTQKVVSAYYDAMYSESEKAAFAAQGVKDQFSALGVQMPTTTQGFRELVQGIDISTTSGQQLVAALMTLAPAFNQVAANAKAAANDMLGALQNYGTSDEVRNFQIDQIRKGLADSGLNLTNDQIGNATRADARALWEQYNAQGNAGDVNARRYADAIFAQQAAFAKLTPAVTTATEAIGTGTSASGTGSDGLIGAANDLASTLQNLTDAIFAEVNRIRGIIPGQGEGGFAAARARLFMANNAANLGDQDAMRALPQLSQAFLALAESNTSSTAELRLIQAQTAAMLENTATSIAQRNGLNIPAFASGGFHDGGWALVGEQGPELAYLPPSHIYNASDTNGMLSASNDSSTADEIKELRRENKILFGQMASLMNRQLKLAENWDGNGLPPERNTA